LSLAFLQAKIKQQSLPSNNTKMSINPWILMLVKMLFGMYWRKRKQLTNTMKFKTSSYRLKRRQKRSIWNETESKQVWLWRCTRQNMHVVVRSRNTRNATTKCANLCKICKSLELLPRICLWRTTSMITGEKCLCLSASVIFLTICSSWVVVYGQKTSSDYSVTRHGQR
jgi:hypothetical protein